MITAEGLIEEVNECCNSLFSMQREGICDKLRGYVPEEVLFKV